MTPARRTELSGLVELLAELLAARILASRAEEPPAPATVTEETVTRAHVGHRKQVAAWLCERELKVRRS
jgi:hypothetical protein